MDLTPWLSSLVGLLAIAGVWRLVRWYWRPRLRLPARASFSREPDGIRVYLEIRNLGAGRSHGCTATLIRCERHDGDRWVRIDALPASDVPACNVKSIPPRGTSRVGLDPLIPNEPGNYRLEVSVINGEERRGSYVIQVERNSRL